ncbi:DUF4397 domain-containing protein [Pedobacter sp. HMF7647]|uniref:DUF4397 domain-containing protein n=1 Tax=Hufsiella arboris TaxID=2695275 RepID=A0A7K1Y6T2_9SPHI|nr:DUF4397 domain-containing protein [Hufsiella arboris]MXV50275.1 DUF4397 domain-containing protein [Hufsiella arboris]
MRNFTTVSSLLKKPILGLAAIALLAGSCKNNNDADNPPSSAISIVHAAPGTSELTFVINGSKANHARLTYGTALAYGVIQPGSYEFSVTKKDSTRQFAKSTNALKNGTYYSLFVVDVPSKESTLLTEDDLSDPKTDQAKIRFINLSPDAGSLDLNIAGTDTLFVKKADFKKTSAFSTAAPGTEKTFEIRENGKTEVLAKIEKVKIEKGKIYTILAKGLRAKTDSTKLSLQVINNK